MSSWNNGWRALGLLKGLTSGEDAAFSRANVFSPSSDQSFDAQSLEFVRCGEGTAAAASKAGKFSESETYGSIMYAGPLGGFMGNFVSWQRGSCCILSETGCTTLRAGDRGGHNGPLPAGPACKFATLGTVSWPCMSPSDRCSVDSCLFDILLLNPNPLWETRSNNSVANTVISSLNCHNQMDHGFCSPREAAIALAHDSTASNGRPEHFFPDRLSIHLF
jgi:hypothetical protein